MESLLKEAASMLGQSMVASLAPAAAQRQGRMWVRCGRGLASEQESHLPWVRCAWRWPSHDHLHPNKAHSVQHPNEAHSVRQAEGGPC